MGRPPLPVGTFGQIHFLRLDKHRVAARTYFRDLDGRRRLVTRYGQTRAQAERRLREALRDRGTGTAPPVPADNRLSDMAALWLADVDGSDRASGTKRLYRFVTDSYVLPAIGELRLREVTVPALDRLLTSVHSAHGPAAAKATRSVLSGILGLAVRHGLLVTNPVRETPARRGPRGSRRRPRALTLEEAHQLRARLADDPTAVRQDLPDLVAFLLGTGLRIGEACAVRTTDLDLDAGTLTVAGTVTRDPLLACSSRSGPRPTPAGAPSRCHRRHSTSYAVAWPACPPQPTRRWSSPARKVSCAIRTTPVVTCARHSTAPASPGPLPTPSAGPWPPGSMTPACPPARSPTTSGTAGPASPRTSTSAALPPTP
jgi:integrase